MTNVIEFRNVSYRYPDTKKFAISNFSLTVSEGEFILIRGSSGSGKSTLLKCVNGLVPSYSGGVFKGKVFVDKMNTLKNPVERIALTVGIVFQDPENQIACTTVESEIAFGLENIKVPREKIGIGIKETASELEIEHLLNRKTSELSSGEKQKIILASVLAIKPKILLMDEPSSQLDAEGTEILNKLLLKLNREKGITILLVEHNFTETKKVSRVINLDEQPSKPPIIQKTRKQNRNANVVLKASNLSFHHTNKKILEDINLEICDGEFISIIGPNGAGKTTLVKHFNGLLKPSKGEVLVFGMNTRKKLVEELAGTVGLLTQNPNDYLFCDTVEGELEFTLKNLGLQGDVEQTLKDFGLYKYRDQYPRDLSGGERQRIALASILIAKPKIVVLDEPTRGIDLNSKKELVETLSRMHSEGKTIILVTHDLELASNSDRIIVVDNGRIVKDGPPEEVLKKDD